MLEWRLLHPWALALVALPLLWLAWRLWRGDRQRPAVLYSSLAPLAAGGQTIRTRLVRLLPLLRAAVLILGVIALARPQYGQMERTRASLGLDIALALDVSESMNAQDFYPNRMEAAKRVVSKFVAERPADRFSLVVFGTTAAILTPPTFDRQVVERFLAMVRTGIVESRSTAIGMGLALAVDRLKDSEAKGRIVILLTDGANNAGAIAPLQAAEMAEALGVRVYTIGVGSNDPRFADGAGFDERTLRQIAETTGGQYFRATNEEALRRIYEEIDRLEKTEIEVTEYADFDEQFLWFWAPALGLLGLELLLRGLVLVRLP